MKKKVIINKVEGPLHLGIGNIVYGGKKKKLSSKPEKSEGSSPEVNITNFFGDLSEAIIVTGDEDITVQEN